MSRSLILAAAAVAALSSSMAVAQDAPAAEAADIKSEINTLQRRLAALEAKQQSDATAAAIQADATQRSQLLQTQGFTAGWDKGFKIQSADGKWVFSPGIQLQFRNITNYTDSDDGDTFENGFELRRMRLRLEGNAFTKNLKYGFVWDSARNAGTTSILDAWTAYTFDGTPWTIKGGQFRNTWIHEGDVADARQMAVERSLVDATFGGTVVDRIQGVEVQYGYQNSGDNPFRAAVAFHDGENSKNTDFRDSDGPDGRIDGNFGLSARAEYKVFGKWANYGDFTAKGSNEDLLVFGGGLNFSENGDTDTTRFTVDGQYENTLGIGAYAALHYVNTDGGAGSTDNFGGLAQVSYLVNPNFEPFARYSVGILDDDFDGEDTFHEFSLGANWYFGDRGAALHNIKFTVDLNYLPNGVPLGTGAATGLGYLAGTEDQFALRAQFQLAF